MSDLSNKIIADLTAELAESKAAANRVTESMGSEILRMQGELEKKDGIVVAIAKTVGAIGDGDDVVAFVERLLEENVRRSKLIAHLDNDKRNAAYDAEAMASIDEALGDHFACIDGHNPYTEERVPMLVAAYDKALAKLAAIRAHLAGADVESWDRWMQEDGPIVMAPRHQLRRMVAAAREALEP